MKRNPFNKKNTQSGIDKITESFLNPGFSLGVDTDIMAPSGKDYITGESIDEHRIVEQANEYIGEEEIKQQFENL
ncbi:MAG TPA: hypothetical protein GX497_14910 [Bacillus bacterium]|nr:hypothetical protein [Bacillus sp. (in: firmicutes)]